MIFFCASTLLTLATTGRLFNYLSDNRTLDTFTVVSFVAGKATCVGKNIIKQETLMTSNGTPLVIKSVTCESIQVNGKNVTTSAANRLPSGTTIQPARKRGIGQCKDSSAKCLCGIADCD